MLLLLTADHMSRRESLYKMWNEQGNHSSTYGQKRTTFQPRLDFDYFRLLGDLHCAYIEKDVKKEWESRWDV
jgi:hypothetical protein